MRIVVRILGFVLMVVGFTVWNALDRYVSPDLPWYRPVELLTWLFYMGAILLFSAGDSRQRALEQYEVAGWKWLWAVATILLGCSLWAVESIYQIRVASWLVMGVYLTPLLVMGLIARMRQRES